MSNRFRQIYVEEKILADRKTQEILQRISGAEIITIDHYKDVFNRKHQDFMIQHGHQKLILARKEGELLYSGAPVCQSFGNTHFYYTSCCMNCIFNCDYCYLKGMYPSGNLVIFVNLEDYFEEVRRLLKKHPVYLCVSYDTDLLALEGITGYTEAWHRFARSEPDLRIEIRTKSAYTAHWDILEPNERCVYAYTISPETVAENFERSCPSLQARLKAAKRGLDKGFSIRLCFDPMIYCENWQEQYSKMLKTAAEMLPMDRIVDYSIGSFRISEAYLKTMRKAGRSSAVVQYPFINDGGVYQYPKHIMNAMEELMSAELKRYVSEDKIFRWKEE